MFTAIAINNEKRSVVLEVENIAPENFQEAVTKVFACARSLGADSPIEVQEDSLMDFSDFEPECVTESKE